MEAKLGARGENRSCADLQTDGAGGHGRRKIIACIAGRPIDCCFTAYYHGMFGALIDQDANVHPAMGSLTKKAGYA
jgi:hypothetical protein